MQFLVKGVSHLRNELQEVEVPPENGSEHMGQQVAITRRREIGRIDFTKSCRIVEIDGDVVLRVVFQGILTVPKVNAEESTQ